MPSTGAPVAADQLYVVYLENKGLIFQAFDAQQIDSRDPQRDVSKCPDWAFAFYYATGPQEVTKVSQLSGNKGFYFIDAIVVPSARLAEYCERTGAYHDVDELVRNSAAAPYHAHTRDGRFYRFDPRKDKLMSTQAS